MKSPFDGEISTYFKTNASEDVRQAIKGATKGVMLEQEGVHLIKFWLNVGRAEQLARFLEHEHNPLKYWKLSWIDVEGLNRWNAYSDAIDETVSKTNFDHSPWHVVRADDKRRARLAVMQTILSQFDYAGRNDTSIDKIDELICGTVDLWNA